MASKRRYKYIFKQINIKRSGNISIVCLLLDFVCPITHQGVKNKFLYLRYFIPFGIQLVCTAWFVGRADDIYIKVFNAYFNAFKLHY